MSLRCTAAAARMLAAATRCAVSVCAAYGIARLHAADIPFEERIQSSPQCKAAYDELSTEGVRVLQDASRLGSELGRMPSYPEYLAVLSQTGRTLSATDRLNLFAIFGNIQRPSISAIELHDLIRAQRNSMAAFRTRYRVEHLVEAAPGDGTVLTDGALSRECVFALSGAKLRFERRDFRSGVLQEAVIEAYDGRAVRGGREMPGAMNSAWIAALDRRKRFFADGNPLLCAKLLDHDADLQTRENWDDLASLAKATFVYESPFDVGQRKCVVVGNEMSQEFCALDIGYALVEQRIGGLGIDPRTGGYVTSGSSWILKNSDFVSVGGKLWLPRRSEFIWTKTTGVVEHYVTTVSSFELNPDLGDLYFADVIPDNAYVGDSMQNVSYINGAAGVEAQLDAVVSSRTGSHARRLWLVGINVAVVIVAGLIIYLRSHRREV